MPFFFIGFLSVVAGCHWGLGLPDRAKQAGYDPTVEYEEGWLFRSVTGQPITKRTQPPRPAAEANRDSRVAAADGSALADGSRAVQASYEDFPTDREQEYVDEYASIDDDKWDESFLDKLDPVRLVKQVTTPKPNRRVAEALFQEGMELYRRGQYLAAAEKFERAAKRWPNSILEEDALFYQGESEFFADRYPQANETYDKLLKKYQYTKYLDRVVARQFSIGRYWDQLENADPSFLGVLHLGDATRPKFDTWRRALKAYQSVRLYDPTGPLADDAVYAIANSQFLRKHYEESAYYYDQLRREYPQSEHLVDAYLLGMKSNLMAYQGPLYDGASLERAEEMADELLALYSDRLGDSREKVLQERNRIYEEKAARDWAVGQYYDRRHYYGAARQYYEYVIREYPGTEAAQLASRRLAEIAGLPPKPPDRFAWLTRWFPSTEED
ncbi:hypothetical protein JCM19992_27520 [Thermostilla marina]